MQGDCAGLLALLLRLRHGMQADDTAFLFDALEDVLLEEPSLSPCSSLGSSTRGGITDSCAEQ